MKNHNHFHDPLFVIVFLLGFIIHLSGQSQPLATAITQTNSIGRQISLPASQHKPGKVYSAVVTSITNLYTYPTSLSTDGNYVVGMPFGGGSSYFWSAATGMIPMPGSVYGVSDNGLASGSYFNPLVQYNGNDVETAGTWDPGTSQWTFLGMNPAVPLIFSTDYNVGWDISSDGSTVVGMQWYQNYSYSAFKWTQAGGYQMIGTGVGLGSRASGISANGNVIYGWAEVPATSRTPVIWYNGQVYYINNSEAGEAFGASPNGNYVTGVINNEGFLWTPQGTTYFSNTLNPGGISPTTVLNNGTVFGYTYAVPTSRRAFVRDSLGTMMTFNNYAEARGLPEAQLWTFYSINDASADGNIFVGAGKTPLGQAITFIIEFIEEPAVFAVSPQSVDFGQIPVGLQSGFQELVIRNAGGSNLLINSLALGGANAAQFVLQDNNVYPLSLGQGDSARVSVAFAPSSTGLKQAAVDIATNTGNYQVPLTGTGTFGVGIGEPVDKKIHVFPLPASTFLHVTDPGGMENVRLFNMAGQLQCEQSCGGKTSVTIDLKGISHGSYQLISTGTDGSRHSVTVMVHK